LGDLGNSKWSPLAWSWKTRWVWRRFNGGSLGQHMLQIMKWMPGLCKVSLLNQRALISTRFRQLNQHQRKRHIGMR
jgi:hypothetical protein